MVNDTVYCGFWINEIKGQYLGATLTLRKDWGFVLVSFLTLYVGYAGGHFWGIVCFAVHQMRATPQARDDLHHQLQILLRTRASSGGMALNMLELSWNRAHRKCTAFLRSLPTVLLATLHLTAFGAAGLFSSTAITNNEALVRSASCGWMDEQPLTGRTFLHFDDAAKEAVDAFLVTARSNIWKGYNYAQSCYGNLEGNTDSLGCNIFITPMINSTTVTKAPCPFPGDVCAGDAITIESGYIDSDRHLGINTKDIDRISVKKVLSCAPLLGEKYTHGWFQPPASSRAISNDTYKAYFFGEHLFDAATGSPSSQYTFAISNFSLRLAQSEYYIRYASYFPGNESASMFTPIPELQAPDADIMLLGLENRAIYLDKIEDPWFEAKLQNGSTFFTPTKELSFLGCTERYQFCTNNQTECTALTGFFNTTPDPKLSPNLNPTQKAVFKLMWKAAESMLLYVTLIFLNKDVLLANNYLWGAGSFASSSLPANHWQNEVHNMFNLSLALLQREVVEYASPTSVQFRPGISSLRRIIRPTEPEALHLCKKVKILTANYTSFSFLGVLVILLAGGIIICTNVSLPKLVSWVQLKKGEGLYQRLEWIETDVLQLHRMACEGRGIRGWNGREDYVPRTAAVGQKFSLTRTSLEKRNHSSSERELLGRD